MSHDYDSLEEIQKRHEAAITYAEAQKFKPTQNVIDRGTLLKMVEALGKSLDHYKKPEAAAEPVLALFESGITTYDDLKLKAMAVSVGGMQPFFATAFLDLMAKGQRGELAKVSPTDLFLGVVKKA